MYKEINTDTWKRKNHYDHFKDFDDPFFNVTGNVDVTLLYDFCKKEELSFFLASLFCSMEATNEVEAFRLRLLDDKVILYKEIHAGSTILHDDETFSFCYFDKKDSIFEFVNEGKSRIIKQQKSKQFEPKLKVLNTVHYSVIPWIAFSSFKHARNFGNKDTVPKIVFGKMFEEKKLKKLPVSVEVNHCLVDGFHVGQYFKQFQEKVNDIGHNLDPL